MFIYEHSFAENGKLLATSAVGPVEGGAGGGLIPWAVLTGYATQDEIGYSATMSEADVSDYSLSSHGLAVSAYDRVEISFAQLRFENKVGGVDIKQNVLGIKAKLYGDVVYDTWPQISLGIQHKTLLNPEIAQVLGASDEDGQDVYLSAAKVWLNGPLNRTVLVNTNIRYSKANQLGLLGYGTDANDDAELSLEFAAAVFLNRRLAIGMEYRQKPDNIDGLTEDDWQDFFVAYFPSKSVSLTLAYLQLGEIAGFKDQDGTYFSIQGSF
ncbi:MAG: DUF3034 family protein [Gammaproteobacteria bacterium]|nr:DUF3034 family protein [Gammaproteobacteria bacterium]